MLTLRCMYCVLCVIAAKMGVEAVNADKSVLKDYELVLLEKDTQCKVDLVMKQFIYYIENETHPVAGILGESSVDLDVCCVLIMGTSESGLLEMSVQKQYTSRR